MKEKFEAFLKEQEVYDEFMNRALAWLGEKELKEMFIQDEPEDWVLSAFDWGGKEDTLEGRLEDIRKWIRIDDLWKAVCGSSQ